MSGVVVTQQVVAVTITPEGQPVITLSAPAPPMVVVEPVGMQGPRGQSGDTFAIEAGEPISALRVLSQANGVAVVANPAALASVASIIGVSTISSVMGGFVDVRRAGTLEDQSWSWVIGSPVFCGAAGSLTQTPPSAVASRHVGIATSPTEILIELSTTFIME